VGGGGGGGGGGVLCEEMLMLFHFSFGCVCYDVLIFMLT